MALTSAEKKSLDMLVWKLSTRLHLAEGGDTDDCESSEERDIIKTMLLPVMVMTRHGCFSGPSFTTMQICCFFQIMSTQDSPEAF